LQKIPEIVGNNIYLRNVKVEDAATIVQWRNDFDLKYLAGVKPIDQASLETEINFAINSEDEAFIMVVKKLNDEPIGYIRLNRMPSESFKDILWLRMVIGKKEECGKGYGGEALRLVLDWLFNELNIHKVECETFNYNVRAIHFFEKVGFKREGLRRKGHFYNGEYYDVIMFGLLKEEYIG